MKFGQALSVLESALPEEVAGALPRAPDRAAGLRAPDADRDRARGRSSDDLGPDWRERARLARRRPDRGRLDRPGAPGPLARRPRGRRQGAVPRRRRGAAVRPAPARPAGPGIGPLVPGIDIKPLVAELQDRAAEELDYHLEAEAQRGVRRGVRATTRTSSCPTSSPSARPCWSPSGWRPPARWPRSSPTAPRRSATTTASCCVRFLFDGPARTGMLHADPHPGNFRILPGPTASPAGSACSTSAPWPGCPSGGLPEAMGRLIRIARCRATSDALRRRAARGGLHQGPHRGRRASCCSTTSRRSSSRPSEERFRFTRAWMRAQFERINDPRDPAYTLAIKLNLPPSYLLIHRTWLGGVGLLSQLEAEVPFRADPRGVRCPASPRTEADRERGQPTQNPRPPNQSPKCSRYDAAGAARAEVGADHGGAEVVELGRDHAAVDPAGHRSMKRARPGSSPSRKNVVCAPSRAGGVELAHGVRDRQRVRRVGEVHLAVGLEVRRRLAVGDDQQHRLGVGVLAEVPVGEQQRRGGGWCPCPTARRAR